MSQELEFLVEQQRSDRPHAIKIFDFFKKSKIWSFLVYGTGRRNPLKLQVDCASITQGAAAA
jgi:hypothetical protein